MKHAEVPNDHPSCPHLVPKFTDPSNLMHECLTPDTGESWMGVSIYGSSHWFGCDSDNAEYDVGSGQLLRDDDGSHQWYRPGSHRLARSGRYVRGRTLQVLRQHRFDLIHLML